MVRLDKYNVLFWEEYAGKPQLNVGYETQGGGVKTRWIRREFGKGNWKDVPFRIDFDSYESALEAIEALKKELLSKNSGQNTEVPF